MGSLTSRAGLGPGIDNCRNVAFRFAKERDFRAAIWVQAAMKLPTAADGAPPSWDAACDRREDRPSALASDSRPFGVSPRAEVVEPTTDLLRPYPGGMGKQGKVGVWFGGLAGRRKLVTLRHYGRRCAASRGFQNPPPVGWCLQRSGVKKGVVESLQRMRELSTMPQK